LPRIPNHLPRVVDDETALEVRLVAGLLEDQILGEVRIVVPNVQARDEDLLRAARRNRVTPRIAHPPNPEAAQLLRRERIGRAGIAPSHVPRVFEEHGLAALLPNLLGEHGAVEVGEFLFHVLGHVHALGETHSPIVCCLHAAIPGQGEDE
jgi:hypothetical protein